MKKIILIFAALLLAFSAFAQDGRSIYNRYSDEEGVTAVYISPAMFRLLGVIARESASRGYRQESKTPRVHKTRSVSTAVARYKSMQVMHEVKQPKSKHRTKSSK